MKPIIGISCSRIDHEGTLRFSVPVAYVERVVEAGGRPLVLPTVEPGEARAWLDVVDGVLLSGGDDVDPALYGEERRPEVEGIDRARDEFEIALARAADAERTPLLGICRGVQVMNVAYEGSLVQHHDGHRIDHEGTHDVEVDPRARLASILGGTTLPVNSRHHQSIDRCAARLRVVARAPDGTPEGAEGDDHPFLVGVQWHPERMEGVDSTRRLFRAFVEAAGAHARRRSR
jgi:putative glutamine amidotransferase